MPYVNIRVTSGITTEQKDKLIAGVTDLLVKVLNKNPERTFVVIDEVEPDNWGVAGVSTTAYRQRRKNAAGPK
jgi:4-oxalocrotonate tautomerase